MAGITKRFTRPSSFIEDRHKLLEYLASTTKVRNKKTRVEVWGWLYYVDEEIKFDSITELDQILTIQGIDKLEDFSLFAELEIKVDRFATRDLLSLHIRSTNHLKTVRVDIDKADFTKLKEIFDGLPSLLEVEVVKYDPATEEREKVEAGIDECVRVLSNLELYQSRLISKISNEKELQSFVFPILKSHFDDLVDETGLPKIAGHNQIPDFGIPTLGLTIECKFLKESSDFRKFKTEIADDLIGYISKESPYSQIIVLIYNSANKPEPANYTADLEKQNGVVKVINSRGIDPS